LVPILAVLGLELVLSALSVSSIRLRRLLCGKPVILIENGHLLQQNLRRTRITVDELTGHLRLKDVLDLNTVQYAILETSGDLSVFLFPQYQPAPAGDGAESQGLPVSIIEDGKLMECGTAQELMEQKGVYYKLYTLQAEALKNVGIPEE
jgi:uncharacterized membrane protein YcaP (DUF421 family)